MSPHDQKKNIPAAGKDETQSTTTRKTSSSSAGKTQAPTSLKCPRCDSPNTKFCYYNNYSLTQPRHFCKTCRRYWTKGGALRNVPVGGGCRKNKKMKSSPGFSCDSSGGNTGGLKFFQGLSPAMDFQINLPNSTTGSSLFNKFSSLASTYSSDGINIISSSSPNNYFSTTAQLNDPSPLMGFSSFPSSSAIKQGHSILNNGSSTTTALSGFHNNNLASSIESLSCINQDLHSKLQQQRLSMMFVGDQKEIMQKHINLFENMDYNNSSKPDDQSCLVGTSRKDGNLSTEWFFDNSYATSSSNNNANDHQSSSREIYQAWSELTDQYTSLP